MIIPFLKVWIFGTLVVWVLLLLGWDWAKLILGHELVPIEDKNRPWWKRPKQEWREREPTYMNALFFAAAWPLLLISLISTMCAVGILKLFDRR